LEIAVVYKVGFLNKAVGERRLAVIDVSYNAKVTDKLSLCHVSL